MTDRKPRVLLLYHFFYPDTVVSARQFTQLAEGLSQRGWEVTVLTSNRCRHQAREEIEHAEETWNGIRIVRVRRPSFNQAHSLLRLINGAIVLTKWVEKARQLAPQDVIILGTDPQFSALILPALRRAHRKAVLAHWCFDLYPDAVIADRETGWSARLAASSRPLMRRAYRRLDLMVDIGPCMRRRLARYRHTADSVTLVPWALAEPEAPSLPDPMARRELFGDAELALLYSGNLGKAHEFEIFLDLARRVASLNPRIVFCFACTGQREAALRAAVTRADQNVRVVGFCDESELEKRLGTADIHMVSLRSQWEGVVVPSKFFGSLAMGRPVLYAGASTSDIAKWIEQYEVGMTVDRDTLDRTAQWLVKIAADRSLLDRWQTNAWTASRAHFSKAHVLDEWDRTLRATLTTVLSRRGVVMNSA